MLESLLKWAQDNLVFSGIGATVVGVYLTWLLTRKSSESNQYQQGGKGSINVQAGKDINLRDIEGKG